MRCIGFRSAVGLLALLSVACGSDAADSSLPIDLPAGFPAPKVPEGNALTQEKISLGRFLFYDVRLSGNEMQSCGSCHEQSKAFADGRVTPEGSTGQALVRNSPGLTNNAYNATLTWANPQLDTLEKQLLVPIFGELPVELGATGKEEEILQRLRDDADYPEMFAAAFPENTEISWDHIVKALASFCRALVSGDSPYDRFVYGGDENALSESAKRGMALFFSEELECHHCHGGFNFSLATTHDGAAFESDVFHNTGLYNVDGRGGYPADNTGLYEFTLDPNDMGRFRAPTLRNVALTAPYMHDGSVTTLEEVIRIYEAGGRLIESGPNVGDGRINPLKSGFVTGFALTDAERADLVAFLESLTDETFVTNPAFSDPFAGAAP